MAKYAIGFMRVDVSHVFSCGKSFILPRQEWQIKEEQSWLLYLMHLFHDSASMFGEL